jgi:hypothetical protein
MTLSGMGRLDGRSAGLGAVAGVLAAGAALDAGQFVAGLTGASGSPVVVVGELQIDFTPPWLARRPPGGWPTAWPASRCSRRSG